MRFYVFPVLILLSRAALADCPASVPGGISYSCKPLLEDSGVRVCLRSTGERSKYPYELFSIAERPDGITSGYGPRFSVSVRSDEWSGFRNYDWGFKLWKKTLTHQVEFIKSGDRECFLKIKTRKFIGQKWELARVDLQCEEVGAQEK